MIKNTKTKTVIYIKYKHSNKEPSVLIFKNIFINYENFIIRNSRIHEI